MADSEDMRQFMREIAMRHERIWRDQRDVFQELITDMRALREDTHAEHVAQNQALLHILDRLENGGAAA